jgi:hypothetical protein
MNRIGVPCTLDTGQVYLLVSFGPEVLLRKAGELLDGEE